MRRVSPVCIVAALLCVAMASDAAAEAGAPKPVLTESVDEPGRSPYQSFASLPVKSCYGSADQQCIYAFDPVPPGRRLVVTYVSVLASVRIETPIVAYLLDSPDRFSEGRIPLPMLSSTPSLAAGVGNDVFGGFTQIYVEAGSAPAIEIVGFIDGAKVAVVGYSVSVP